MNAIELAIICLGGVNALGRAIGVENGHIYYWRKTNKVSSLYCRAIEAATNGLVTRYQLRPDVFGEGPDDVPEQERHAA